MLKVPARIMPLQIVTLSASVFLGFLIPAGSICAEFSPNEVFVEVNWSGWNIRLTGSGWLGFVSEEQDGGLKHVSIDSGVALDLINRLLDIGFMHMPEVYPSVVERLLQAHDGTLLDQRGQVIDGGQIRLRLKIGPREKQVVIEQPVETAPLELESWFREFEVIATKNLFGG